LELTSVIHKERHRKRTGSFGFRAQTASVFLLVGWLLSACNPQVPPGFQPSSTSLPQEIPAQLPATSEVFLPYSSNQEQANTPTATITQTPEPTPSLTAVSENKIRFAVIGDYGLAGQPELEVAALIAGWQPDLIITTGDNNYPDGEASTIDENIGQYYSEYIYPYQGEYGPGGDQNRFYPSLGNHDWTTPGAGPYLDYFSLPGNERYYDFVAGPVQFFVLNSDWREPDGVSRLSTQANWLESAMSASTAPWQIVYFHAAPYSSGLQGSTDWMRWPFNDWGADAVLAGHDHVYERLLVDGLVYFVNGLGGGPRYYFADILDTSQFRYDSDHGAMLVEATSTQISFQFWNRAGQLIDEYWLTKTP
jgi:tartrate-resistant acid phosphatase type 5